MSIRHFLLKNIKNLTDPKLLNGSVYRLYITGQKVWKNYDILISLNEVSYVHQGLLLSKNKIL